jgi:opacity protein-like surface antigen
MKHQAMKQTCQFWIIALMIALIVPSTVYAENNPFYIGVSIGPVINQLDETEAENQFVRPVSLDYGNTTEFQLKTGLFFNEYLSGEFIFEYLFPFKDETNLRTVKVDALMLSIQGKYRFPQPGPIQPYGLFGLGMMNTQMKAEIRSEEKSQSIKESDWGISTKLGGGANIYITPDIFTNLELCWTLGLGKVSHINYPAFLVGLNYRF